MSENDPSGLGPGEDEDSEKSNPNVSLGPSRSSQVAEMDDLNERFSQQQVMISQLKEMVIAEEAARTQKIASSRLKMEKCVSQLARIRDRAKVTKLKNAPDSSPVSSSPVPVLPSARDSSRDSSFSASEAGSLPLQDASFNVSVSSPAIEPPPPLPATNLPVSTASPTVLSVPHKSTDPGTKAKTPSREVTKILHQQIKEHKAMIAERAKNEKELEVALAKIQKQLEESQNQSAELLQLGQSKAKVSLPILSHEESAESNRTINELRNKIASLEGNILDLQETCKEKDSVIDSKTKAITLMSADLSKKGKNTLDLLDDTKEQMQKMQENFASMESKMNMEKQQISDELEVSKNRIIYLEEANTILETERFNLSIHNNKLEEELTAKEIEINRIKTELVENLKNIEELNSKVDKSIETDPASYEEKGSSEISQMNSLSEKIEILEKLNSVLRQSNIELQEKINPSVTPEKEQSPSKHIMEETPKAVIKKGKAAPKPKGSQKYKYQPIPSKSDVPPKAATPVKVDSPPKPVEGKDLQETVHRLQIVIQSLNNQVLEKEILLNKKEAEYIELKDSLADTSTDEIVDKYQSETRDNSESIGKPSDNLSSSVDQEQEIIDSAPTSLEVSLSSIALQDLEKTEDSLASGPDTTEGQLDVASREINKLSKELAEANKNMLKVKVSHKAKVKQMQKSIDDFSKVSDSNSQMVRLQGEVSLLTQKIAELEDEKGNLQLHLVDYDSGRVSDSQLHAKLLEMENIAEERLKAIADLETQKFDLVQELHSVKQQIMVLEDKVSDLTYFENEHVSAELKSAQLEEQLDVLTTRNTEILMSIDHLKAEKLELLSSMDTLHKEKAELSNKLELYIQENMDLIDRLDKLSAEKVSSAESIEMVESLTTQEKMEIEQYEKSLDPAHPEDDDSLGHSNIPEEIIRRDSSSQCIAESSELQAKIDLFTQERHEVMEKLDILKNENIALSSRLEELLREKDTLEENYEVLKVKTGNISEALRLEEDKNQIVNDNIDSLKQENRALLEQIKKLFVDENVITEEAVVAETIKPLDAVKQEIVEPPSNIQDSTNVTDATVQESKSQTESPEKAAKANSKDLKKLTKEILRLKGVIKHQEAEIQNLTTQLSEVKDLPSEIEMVLKDKNILYDELQNAMQDNTNLNQQLVGMKEEKDAFNHQVVELQKHLHDLTEERQTLITSIELKESAFKSVEEEMKAKDSQIGQLQSLNDQLKSDIESFNDVISKKDKEIAECINQIDQLDSVSKKLKSTITQHEEDQSASSQHANIIKNLELNIVQLQNAALENENKLKDLQSELVQSTDSAELLKQQLLEHQSKINDLKNTLNENQKEMNIVNNEKDERNNEILRLQGECSNKDEEIHEIKLQLRKESIEYDKLKNSLKDIENSRNVLQTQVLQLEETCASYQTKETKQQEDSALLDKKCKEQFEKLKKFAANIKKKASVCTELETQVANLKTELKDQLQKCEEFSLRNNALQQELHVLNSQYNIVQSEVQQASSSQMSLSALEHQITELQNEITDIQSQYSRAISQIHSQALQNQELVSLNESLVNQLSEKEISVNQLAHQKDSVNNQMNNLVKELENTKLAVLKIDELENHIHEKQKEVTDLIEKLDEVQSNYDNFKCGHEAKIQERDLYIENLQAEIVKHKDRVSRLEDSVSTMEERRSSLERKTDRLVTKLHEKDAACSESSIHEDELEKRLSALIMHDELIQQQLQDTQNQNQDYLQQVNSLSESNKIMKSELENARSTINNLTDEVSKFEVLDEERIRACERVNHLETELKRLSVEYSEILKNKSKEYGYLESDLHSQISNSEAQKRAAKEQYERLQDEMQVQTQTLKDFQIEFDFLRTEHENTLQKLHFETSKKQTVDTDFEKKFSEVSRILEEKEYEIQKLTSKLHEESQKAIVVAPPETLKNYFGDDTSDQEKITNEKNREIEKLNEQFKSCLAQLSEAVDAEKYLKESCLALNKSINEKDLFISKLQSDLMQWSALYQNQQLSAPSNVVDEAQFESKSIQQSSTANVHKPLCPEPPPLNEEALKFLQDQIISSDTLGIQSAPSAMEKQMIRNFQHDSLEPVRADAIIPTDNNTPVVEDILQPKKVSLLFTDEPVEQTMEEDGWGFSEQDLVSKDRHTELLTSQSTAVWDPNTILDLEARIQFLTEEKHKISIELTQSQQKVTKALIKLKEFKHKNEILSKELKTVKATSNFNMLDMTIQDELASQVKKLEDKIKEILSDTNKEKLEKEGMLKRIDVLTAANERLMEMKERQDVEMDVWKSKNKGLSERIKNLEWDTNFSDETDTVELKSDPLPKAGSGELVRDEAVTKQISELNKKIEDLEADNEELQAFIEEQQALINKSKSLESDLQRLKNQESSELAEVRKENESLKLKLNEANDHNIATSFQTQEALELSELKNINTDMSEQLKEFKDHYNKINSEIEKYKIESLELAERNKEILCLKENLNELRDTHNAASIELENTVKENVELKKELENLLKSKNQSEYCLVENADLKEKLEALIKEYYEFQEKFNEAATVNDKIEMELYSIRKEKEELEFANKDITAQESACKAELIKISYENEELAEKYDNLLKKLNDKNVSDETKQIISFTDQVHNLSHELDSKSEELIALNHKINAYETEKQTLQENIEKLNSENTVLLSNLAELRNNVTDAIDQRGTEVAEMWKQHLAMREVEFSNLEQALIEAKESLDSQRLHFNDLYSECNKTLEDTKKELEAVTDEKNKYITLYETDLPLELHQHEILVQDKEDQERAVVEKEHEILLLNQELVQLKHLGEKALEYEQIIATKDTKLEESFIKIKQLEENYNRKVYEYEIIFNTKDTDFDHIRQQLYQAETKLSDVSHECEAELATMRLQIHEERTAFENSMAELRNKAENLEMQLDTKINECRVLNMKIVELQTLVDEENAQLIELRKALEAQEIEIVTLKENLAQQADAYEQLAISHLQENYKNKSDRHVTFSEDTKPGAEINEMQLVPPTDAYEKTPRADLDLALYMLHQRDVRCEELTVELMQLLEERDTLQLKLSNSIRANEEMRSKRSPSLRKTSDSTAASGDNSAQLSEESRLASPSGSREGQSPGEGQSEVGSRTEEIPTDDQSLATKLSQLHKVGHTRDIRLRDESEIRNRQMELLQRDVQNLPPEAAARLRETHFTLTRDTQSASTVLLNWLWGKTTPKVVHM